MSNPASNSSLCRTAAPRLRPLQLLLPTRLPLDPLQLLLPVCIRFSCCSPLAAASAAALDCVRFNCSPIASASAAAPPTSLTAAPRLRPLQLPPLPPPPPPPRLRLIQLQLPDCVHLQLLLPTNCSGRFQPMPNILEHSSQSSRFSKLKYEGRASLV